MPKKIYPLGPGKRNRRWRIEFRASSGHIVTSYYHTRVGAVLDAYWRVLITPGWDGEIVLFDVKALFGPKK